ncbi:MAG: hypothetical protein J6A16_02145, partial [Oscillospiraceae bacterium]|nr:hypothetical protein [Oscillospiraceae bacterium]
MKTKGWQKVFCFTFMQHIKTKSFIIGTIIVCLLVALLAAGTNVLPKLISDEEEVFSDTGDAKLEFPSTVYIYDNCGALAEEDIASIAAMGVSIGDGEPEIL